MFDRVQHFGIPVGNIENVTNNLITNLGFENIFETTLNKETDPIRIVFLKYEDVCLEFYEAKGTLNNKVGNIDHIAIHHHSKLKEGLIVEDNIRLKIDYNREKQGLNYVGINTENLTATTNFLKELGFSISGMIAKKNDVIFKIIETRDTEKLRNGVIDHIALNSDDVSDAFCIIKEKGINHLENQVTYLPFFKQGVRYITAIGPNDLKIELNESL